MALRRKDGAEVVTYEIPDRESEQGATYEIKRLSILPHSGKAWPKLRPSRRLMPAC